MTAFPARARACAAALLLALAGCEREPEWTVAEKAQVATMTLAALAPLPAAPSNAVADNPRAAELGAKLFADPRLSANGQISCASCHKPERFFTDGLPLAKGLGTDARHTPGLIGVAYRPWLFWDGRADSLWSQVAGPLEDGAEMGQTRTGLVRVVAQHYREDYEALFGPLPPVGDLPDAGPNGDDAARSAWRRLTGQQRREITRVLANVGKAIAAHERTLLPTPARFDVFAEGLRTGNAAQVATLTQVEQNGLRLFLGRGQCTRCHQGPLLTDNAFHNTGLGPGATLDRGRIEGVEEALASELNCRGTFSDASPDACTHLDLVQRGGAELVGAFKTPSLRNVAATAPYMHDGRFATLADVLDHYNRAPSVMQAHGRTELVRLGLMPGELLELEAFLGTLTAGR